MKQVKYLLIILVLVLLTGCGKKSNEKVQEFYISIFENSKSYINADDKEEFISHYTDKGYKVKEYAFIDYGDDEVIDVVAKLVVDENSKLDDIGLILTYNGGKIYGHEVSESDIEVVTDNGISFFHGDNESGWKTYSIDKEKIIEKIIYSKSYDGKTCIENSKKVDSCSNYEADSLKYSQNLSFDLKWVTYNS